MKVTFSFHLAGQFLFPFCSKNASINRREARVNPINVNLDCIKLMRIGKDKRLPKPKGNL